MSICLISCTRYSHIYKIYNLETLNTVAIATWNGFLAGHSLLDPRFPIRHPSLKQEVTRLVAKQDFHIFHLARFWADKMTDYLHVITIFIFYKLHIWNVDWRITLIITFLGVRSEINGIVYFNHSYSICLISCSGIPTEEYSTHYILKQTS